MRAQQYRIEIVNKGKTFFCAAGNSLLHVTGGAVNPFISVGCQSGGCGVCKIKILEGQYSAKRMSSAHISDNDRKKGVLLACRVYPSSDMLIDITTVKTSKNT